MNDSTERFKALSAEIENRYDIFCCAEKDHAKSLFCLKKFAIVSDLIK